VRGRESAQKLGLPNVTPLELDVTSPASVQAAVATVAKDFPGGLDLLVNNAGIFHKEDTGSRAASSTVSWGSAVASWRTSSKPMPRPPPVTRATRRAEEDARAADMLFVLGRCVQPVC